MRGFFIPKTVSARIRFESRFPIFPVMNGGMNLESGGHDHAQKDLAGAHEGQLGFTPVLPSRHRGHGHLPLHPHLRHSDRLQELQDRKRYRRQHLDGP